MMAQMQSKIKDSTLRLILPQNQQGRTHSAMREEATQSSPTSFQVLDDINLRNKATSKKKA